ncbi:MAG: BlaI/MecI/CopY family transcriptional regulator [Gemmiger qucibialis]
MKALSTSEEQVMAALWACGKPATRRQIAAKLPPDCVWADSTLLNFLLRLEAKGYVRPEKQGNKNIYTPLVRRVTYCGAVSAAHLQTLYVGTCAAWWRRYRIPDASPMLRWSVWPAGWTPAWLKARNTITIDPKKGKLPLAFIGRCSTIQTDA